MIIFPLWDKLSFLWDPKTIDKNAGTIKIGKLAKETICNTVITVSAAQNTKSLQPHLSNHCFCNKKNKLQTHNTTSTTNRPIAAVTFNTPLNTIFGWNMFMIY